MSLPDELYNIKFAEHMESLKILYLVDPNFKVICNEYCLSTTATKKYKGKIEKYFNKKIESENLSKELEEEILIYLLRRK
ncbi:hypothetical protein SAMN05444397_101897 [Flavobacterium aquidurense]|uniref:Uncharacterized protein n=1 Tax=Flavobacterium frigidimaris TaxID=262320 RepID=A0ABX4BWN1_FLAFR|nr:hypothetical protein B0A65_01530 [Flavobacterium frigidimaris]SDY54405.1 hypothetical protein SAMN05444397_101897 [Flavobacterium aquidurense]